MSLRRLILVTLLTALAMCLVQVANAGVRVISGNFGGGWSQQFSPAPTRVDGVVQTSNWNFFDCGSDNNWYGVPHSIEGLVDGGGEATGVGATLHDIGVSSFGETLVGPATSILGSGEVDDAGGPARLTVTNIPYAKYDVYAYAGATASTINQSINLISPTSIPVSFLSYTNDSILGTFNDATTDGVGNYVKFSGLTSKSCEIHFSASPGRGGIASGFQIVEQPVIENAPGASNVTATNAFLNGTLVMTDSVPSEVWVYWGKTDGGTNSASWANTNYFGTNTGTCPVPYTTNVPLPTESSVYYYRYCQRNSFFTNWASSTTNFINDVVRLAGIDTNASETWLDTATFRVWRSTTTTNSAVRVNYSLSGTASNGIDYVPLPGFVIISAGATNADVLITPIDDFIPYQTNHFISIVLGEGGYVIGSQSNAVVVITENDMNVAYQPASIGITFGDGTQGPPLGSHTGPGVAQDYWNNVDVRPWATTIYQPNDAGINCFTGYGPYESDTPTIIAIRDSHNNPVSIGFTTSNRAQVRAFENNRTGFGGFTGTAPTGPNSTNYDQKVVSWDPGQSEGPNWVKITGITYNNYNVYIWGTGLNLGPTNTGVYFNGATNFTNLSGDFCLDGTLNTRTISYIQIVENPIPPYVNNEPGPVERPDGSGAWLRGTLLATNGSPAELWVYWGLTDGGANVANWGNTNYLGINTGACPATNSVKVFLPLPNATYYYRYCASNAVGLGWANSTTNFGNHGGTVLFVR